MPENIQAAVAEFDKLIIWKNVQGGANGAQIPEPQQGIDAEFDAANQRVDEIKRELNEYLKSVSQQFKDRRI